MGWQGGTHVRLEVCLVAHTGSVYVCGCTSVRVLTSVNVKKKCVGRLGMQVFNSKTNIELDAIQILTTKRGCCRGFISFLFYRSMAGGERVSHLSMSVTRSGATKKKKKKRQLVQIRCERV